MVNVLAQVSHEMETAPGTRLFRRRLGTITSGKDPYTTEEADMGFLDKLKNKGDTLKGDAKQKAGKALDNEQMQAEGKAGSAKGNLKQAGENVKDAL
jgi:uncharacterized protein YjbJ (UPF0337 family)